jgi:LAO/AO transport system kinase
VVQLSALSGQGIDAFWAVVSEFRAQQDGSGRLAQRRSRQSLAWMWERIETGLKQAFRAHPGVRERLPEFTDAVLAGRCVPSAAARQLLGLVLGSAS